MLKTRFAWAAWLSLAVASLAFGRTYKSTYPVPCGELWGAVKVTLSDPEHYGVAASDDAKMKADYHVKHSVHASVSGTLLQRTNHVTLVPQGGACEMQIVSNFSGFEHNDREDFRKRVEEALAKPKSAPSSPPAKPEAPAQ